MKKIKEVDEISEVSPLSYKVKRVLSFFLMLWLAYTILNNVLYILTFGNSNDSTFMLFWVILWTVIWSFVCRKAYLVFRGRV